MTKWEFNPLLTKNHSKSTTLRRTKADKFDFVLISTYLTTVDYKPNTNQSYHIHILKSLSRLRDSLVKQCSQILVHITIL